MHPGASAGKCCGNIHNGFAIPRNYPHEEEFVSAFAAAETGSNCHYLIPFFSRPPSHGIPPRTQGLEKAQS